LFNDYVHIVKNYDHLANSVKWLKNVTWIWICLCWLLTPTTSLTLWDCLGQWNIASVNIIIYYIIYKAKLRMANFFEAFKFSSWILFFLQLSPFKLKKKTSIWPVLWIFLQLSPLSKKKTPFLFYIDLEWIFYTIFNVYNLT